MLVGYARVSTLDQNPQLQINALQRAGCDKIFTEKKSTRTKTRPALDDARSYLRPGDTLVVWKLDRLDRTVLELVHYLDDLARSDIHFRSLTETLDTATPYGRALFHVSAAFAELERSLIRERTLAGLQAARDAGKILGRPSKLDPGKLKLARAMLTDPDISTSDIAKQLGVARSTLYRHLPGSRRTTR